MMVSEVAASYRPCRDRRDTCIVGVAEQQQGGVEIERGVGCDVHNSRIPWAAAGGCGWVLANPNRACEVSFDSARETAAVAGRSDRLVRPFSWWVLPNAAHRLGR